MKSKVETLEAELKEKETELEKTEKTEKTMEEQIIDLKNEVEFLKKKPLIDKCLEVKQLDDREIEFLKTQDKDYLEGKYEQWKNEAESKIHIKSQEESAEEAKEKAEEELSKKEPSMEKFTEHIKHKVKIEKDEEK
jgi:translation initiation factor 2B subunit (eIF-2B alpha/beta/delta family)